MPLERNRVTARVMGALPARAQPLVRRALSPLFPSPEPEDHDAHPERRAVLDALLPVRGPVVEVGCGHRKTLPGWIGIDLVPGGQAGRVGNAAGQLSTADLAASGERLPVRDGALGAVVARHNLEHYVDTLAVLDEWRRTLRVGGQLVVVVPDEESYPGSTIELDPTHYHAFTPASLRRLVEAGGGWRVEEVHPAIASWSFLLRATRTR